MINNLRVGIPIVGGKGWQGGISHMELHVKAVTTLPKQERPQIFLIITEETLDSYIFYRPFIHLFDGAIFLGREIEAAAKITGLLLIHCQTWDDLFAKIDFLFPVSFNVLPDRCSASWVHDFQHKHLPDFFPAQDLALREELCQHIADQARLIFCSSYAVEHDFRKFYPDSKAQTMVLSLRIMPESDWFAGNPAAVQQHYGLPDEFIICSNQFWVHKNHRLLFEAIYNLRQNGRDIHLVCTGLTHDFRCPGYFEELKDYISVLGITDLVHILGQIPRQDQIQLIRRSMFTVQPSLFEGLGLIVQECRALGKPIILSDIDAHLEHEYGVYFNRTDAEDLTDKLAQLISCTKPGPDFMREAEARLQAVGLAKRYARSFCHMVAQSQTIFAKYRSVNSPVLIATSLTTANISTQQQAITSWLKAGFAVVSLNRPDDIAALRPLFPNITFIEITNKRSDASPITINDLIDYLAQSDADICGIVEPDIYLYGKNLVEAIAKEAVNCFVYQERTSVEAVDNFDGMAFPGFGCVFFDRRLTVCYSDEGFRLDQPWWDYWTIIMPIIRRLPVKRITTPFAYHVTHSEQYDIGKMIELSGILAKYAPPPFSLSAENLAKYRHILAQIIGNHSFDIALNGLNINDDNQEEQQP